MWWILTVLITAPLVAMAAGLTMFQPNTVISSSAVNANFQSLSDRITALENAKTTVTLVLDNMPGPLPIPATTATTPISFTTAGGQVMILISASSYGPAGTTMDFVVQIDGAPVGHLQEYTNEGGSHKAFPTRILKPTLAAGAHNVQLLTSGTIQSDANDHFSMTVIEFAH
jgi:hypothetical protein